MMIEMEQGSINDESEMITKETSMNKNLKYMYERIEHEKELSLRE